MTGMTPESTDHIADAFCFDCAHPSHADVPLPDLNPWPGLVHPGRLAQLRCQPVVRLVYTPRPFDALLPETLRRPVAQDRSPTFEEIMAFRDGWSVAHEYAHFHLMDRTPAKELARVYLAYAYDLIGFLVRSLSESTAYLRWVFDRFQTANRAFLLIGRRIAFGEELFATATALEMVEASRTPGKVWHGFDEECALLRAEVLQAHEDQPGFRGFTDAYQRLTALLAPVPGGTSKLSMILPVVQAVRYDADAVELVALDARERLMLLIDLLAGVESKDDIRERLAPLRSELDEGWKLTVMLQQENADQPVIREHGRTMVYGMIAGSLLQAIRGDLVYDHYMHASRPPKDLSRIGPPGYVILRSESYRRRVGVTETVLSSDGSTLPPAVENAYGVLSFWESLRQQLSARQGIVCPYNPYGFRRCRCPAKLRRAMHGLARLARDGVFGEGAWSTPDCRA